MFKPNTSPPSNQQPESQPTSASNLYKSNLSTPILALLHNLIHKHFKSYHQLPSQKIRELCQLQLQRLAEIKKKDARLLGRYLDNELTISIIKIQSIFFIDMKHEEQNNSHTSAASKQNKEGQISPKYSINSRRLDILVNQIDKNELQIKRFMDSEVLNHEDIDIPNCIHFFLAQANTLKKFGSDKLIASRMRLLKTLIYLLRASLKQISPEKLKQIKGQQLDFDGSIIYDVGVSFLSQLNNQNQSMNEVNSWQSLSSKCLEDKFLQLSTICQQITQLEVFNRTLQFIQLDNCQKIPFLKIIQVLISLHHRVSYLSRKKPHLIKEIQNAEKYLQFINSRLEEFIMKIQSDRQGQIIPIDFTGIDDKWKSQLSQPIAALQTYIHRMSEIIVNQDLFHSENIQRNERLFGIVEIFSKVLAGSQELIQDWLGIIDNLSQQSHGSFSTNEKRIILLLDECLAAHRLQHSNVRTRQNLSNRTNDELTYEVNKLIEDYQRIQKENINLATNLQLEHRLKQELLAEVDEREKLINSLSARNLNLEHWLANKDEEQSQPEDNIKEEDLTDLQREVQQCREHNLLFREQLLASEKEREKLQQFLEAQQSENIKLSQSINSVIKVKEQVQTQNSQLKNQIESLKKQNIRHVNRLNDLITDLANQKSFTERELQISKSNNTRLNQRLQKAQKKIEEYNKLIMNRFQQQEQLFKPSFQRELHKLRKQHKGYQQQAKELDIQNQTLREENAMLKFKIKQSQIFKPQQTQDEDTLANFNNNLKNARKKNQILTQSLEKAQTQAQHFKDQLKKSKKTIEELQKHSVNFQYQKKELQKMIENYSKRQKDLLQRLQSSRSESEKQINSFKSQISKKQIQLLEKSTAINSLQLKIRMLDQQLLQKNQESSRCTQELVQTKIRQYQTTIETHKLIEVKMEEQARSLKQSLEQRITNQFRLSSEINRLSKEIDRLKATLQKYIMELKEKQIVIKLQREKNDNQLRKLREFQIIEKVKKQRSSTPQAKNEKTSRFLGIPASEAGINHDNEANKYDRLYKEYEKYKMQANKKITALRRSLQEGEKGHQLLKGKLSAYQDFKYQFQQSNKRQQNELQQAMKQLSILKQQRKIDLCNSKKLANQIQSLKAQLLGVRQRLNDQSNNFSMLANEKKILQDRLSSIQFNLQTTPKENDLMNKIAKLKTSIKQLEARNAELHLQKLEHQKQMRQQFDNMYNHYESEMKRVISETNHKSLQQQTIIQQLRQKIRQYQSLSTSKSRQVQLQDKVSLLQSQIVILKDKLQETQTLLPCKLKSKTSGEYLTGSSIMTNLLQFAFRILIYFAEASSTSPQAEAIKNQLESISKKHQGVDFFRAIEEYSIEILKNSSVNVYKKDLKMKGQELEVLRLKLRELIGKQIEQKEEMVNRRPISQRGHKTVHQERDIGYSLGQNATLST